MQSLSAWCFGGCTSLKSITIPTGVTSIPNAAFSGCI
ncbi:MAG: leucine-rich repeat protein [Prevotella sp.]|nr:leucine-rich repeat protein [Prevotella sp.]